MTLTAARPVRTLARDEWRTRRRAHEDRIDALTAGHLARRRTGAPHPVEDFLFTYYSYRPARLRRWHPGPGIALEGADFGPPYRRRPDGTVTLDVAAVMARRGEAVRLIHRLLVATAARPPYLGCFGLHEWAMVYRQRPEEVRHDQLPLRLGPERTAAVVDEAGVRCTHFDAFRFFTAPARPLNVLQPTRAGQVEYEQPGCLHANMDVYRWAYKLMPLVPSELLADCFCLAKEIRTLDMRASPYDLTSLGLAPVAIETPEGRAEYVRAQRAYAERAAVLRQRLLDCCEAVLGTT